MSRERKGKTNRSVVLLRSVFQVPALFPKRRLLNLTRFNLCCNARTQGEAVRVFYTPHTPALLVANPHGAGGAAAANSSQGPWAAPPQHSTGFWLPERPTHPPQSGGRLAGSAGEGGTDPGGSFAWRGEAAWAKKTSHRSHHEPCHPWTSAAIKPLTVMPSCSSRWIHQDAENRRGVRCWMSAP